MATKEDMQTIRDAFSEHDERISELERAQLPNWFWPTLGSVAVIVGSVTSVVELILTHANTVANATSAANAITHSNAVLRSLGHN